MFVGFSRTFLLVVLILKGLTVRRLYKSFGVKGLNFVVSSCSCLFRLSEPICLSPLKLNNLNGLSERLVTFRPPPLINHVTSVVNLTATGLPNF
jgi:hypothetical protein